MEKKGKKVGIEERIARLKELADIAEKARLDLEREAQEARKEAEDIIPKIKADVEEIDGKITTLQQERAKKLEQLKLLGLKVKAKGVKGVRAGGLGDKLKEMIRSVGMGAVISNADINEFLGSSSGYVGMLVKANIEAGNLQRTEPGKYEVTGIP